MAGARHTGAALKDVGAIGVTFGLPSFRVNMRQGVSAAVTLRVRGADITVRRIDFSRPQGC
jgi:hypothetical protein